MNWWWLIPIGWVAGGVFSTRFTLWSKDSRGKWRKEPGRAWVFGFLWPFIIGIGIPAAIVGGVGYLVTKGISIPFYYWATPKAVRKAKQ